MDNIICYYVAGLGSEKNEGEEKYITENIFKTTNQSKINYKTHKDTSAIKNIFKKILHISPLHNSNFVYNLAYDIIVDLQRDNIVFVLGHSFGGMIVNKTAEIIQTIFDNKPIDRSNLIKKINDKINTNDNESDNTNLYYLLHLLNHPDLDKSKSLLEKLQIATFGSIYFAKRYEIDKLKIYNYISSSDPANACNGLTKKKILPIILKNTYNDLIYSDIQEKEKDKDPYIIQICLHKISYKDNTELCLINKKNEICDRNRITNWEEHVSYVPFMKALLENKDLNVYNIPNPNIPTKFILENKKISNHSNITDKDNVFSFFSRKTPKGGKKRITKKRKTKNKRRI